MSAVVIVCFFTACIHVFETLALGMRYAGAKTKQIATSISFVNTSFLIARLSNMFQAPLLGALVDQSIKGEVTFVLWNAFRMVLLSAFIGNLIGAFLLPTLTIAFEKAIIKFSHNGSMVKILGQLLNPLTWFKLIKIFRFPGFSLIKNCRFDQIPRRFIYFNAVLVSIYAVGVLSSLMAGALLPDLRATAVQLSGIVNGMATIMLTLFVDPTGSLITDQTVHGKRPVSDVKSMIVLLVISRLIGTLILAQIIFVPATSYIMKVTEFVSKLI